MANCLDWGPVGNPSCCGTPFCFQDRVIIQDVQTSGCGRTLINTQWLGAGIYTAGNGYSANLSYPLTSQDPNTGPVGVQWPNDINVGTNIFGYYFRCNANNALWEYAAVVDFSSSQRKKYYVNDLCRKGFYISVPLIIKQTGAADVVIPDGFRHYNYGVITGVYTKCCGYPPGVVGATPPDYCIEGFGCTRQQAGGECYPDIIYTSGLLGTPYQSANYWKGPIGTLIVSPLHRVPSNAQQKSISGSLDPTVTTNLTFSGYSAGGTRWHFHQTGAVPWPAGATAKQFAFYTGFHFFHPRITNANLPVGTHTMLHDCNKETLDDTQFPPTGGIAAPLPATSAPW